MAPSVGGWAVSPFPLDAGHGAIVTHMSMPTVKSMRVANLIYLDKPDAIATLMVTRPFCALGIDVVIGHVERSRVPGSGRVHPRCDRRGRCAQRASVAGPVYEHMFKLLWVFQVVSSEAPALAFSKATIVLVTDTDTYLVAPAAEIERKFRAFQADVVLGMESELYPKGHLLRPLLKRGRARAIYPRPSAPSHHVAANGGGMAGTPAGLAALARRMRAEWNGHDAEHDHWLCCPHYFALSAGPEKAGGMCDPPAPKSKQPECPFLQSGGVECFDDQHCLHSFVAMGFATDGQGPRVAFDWHAELFVSLYHNVGYIRLLPESAGRGPGRLAYRFPERAESVAANQSLGPSDHLPCVVHTNGEARAAEARRGPVATATRGVPVARHPGRPVASRRRRAHPRRAACRRHEQKAALHPSGDPASPHHGRKLHEWHCHQLPYRSRGQGARLGAVRARLLRPLDRVPPAGTPAAPVGPRPAERPGEGPGAREFAGRLWG